MEVCVAAGVLGIGYLFSKDGLNRENKKKFITNISKNNLPTGNNIYNSKETIKIIKNQQKKADNLFKETLDKNSNVIIAGPPEPLFHKVDYTNKNLPIEFDNNNRNIDLNNTKQMKNTSQIFSMNKESSGGWHGISLTGEPINPENFKHNNMVPFFGSKIKQNVDEYANNTIMENFTGSSMNYQKKKEVEYMFKPQKNITNAGYGFQNLDLNMKDRYIVGNIMNNTTPFESVHVGPGLNKGYTSQPSGGFQQADTREYIMPKTTNQLRVKTNPKLSYSGSIITGKAIGLKPGKVGVIEKNRPDTFYIQTPDMYFTTTGACTGAKQRPNIVMKHVNRKTTQLKKRVGPAAPTKGSKEKIRSKVKNSRRIQLKNDGPRNLGMNRGNKTKDDYGKKNYRLKKTIRQCTGGKTQISNLTRAHGADNVQARNTQKPRRTRKTNVIGNARWTGNVQGPQNRHTVYDPNDVARTTIKETNIHNTVTANFGNTGPSRQTVYDPNDVARTTIKETNIHNNVTANYNRQDTLKPYVYDPNDIAKITTKQTTMARYYVGNPENEGQGERGYSNTSYDFGENNRDTTNMSYTNNPHGQDQGGYQVAGVQAPNTNRQFSSREYAGGAGNGAEIKPISYADVYNATIRGLKEKVSMGRAPTLSGAKKTVGGSNIKMSTRKMGDIQNEQLEKRGRVTTRVHNSLPVAQNCGVTSNKETVPNEPLQQRLDPSMLDAYKKNPFTQSLKSYAYS